MDFTTWHTRTSVAWVRHYRETEWRKGQTYFNLLYDERPDVADRVRGTAVDPFHQDEKLPVFLDVVCGLWDA
jgi:hypothetical protein